MILTPENAQLLAQFGVAAPLFGVLIYLLRQSNEERREITSNFLTAMESIIVKAAEAGQAQAGALTELKATIRETGAVNSAEHKQMIEQLRLIHETQVANRAMRQQAGQV